MLSTGTRWTLGHFLHRSATSTSRSSGVIRSPSCAPAMSTGTVSDGNAGDKKFAGKVAIVTASTDGIGLSIARRLAEDGCHVMVSSRKAANVEKTVQELSGRGLSVHGVPCHVAKADDRQRLVSETVERFGGVDFFVSNAAANPAFGRTLDCTEDQLDKIFDTNVKAAFLLTQLIVPEIRKRGQGSLVYISSLAGYSPLPMLGAYSVSKTALLGLVKALSADLAPEEIRVNAVAPGIVKTKFASALTESEDISERVIEQLHLKRFGTPDDISGVVSFLCSDDARYVTGETLVAAGGLQSRL